LDNYKAPSARLEERKIYKYREKDCCFRGGRAYIYVKHHSERRKEKTFIYLQNSPEMHSHS